MKAFATAGPGLFHLHAAIMLGCLATFVIVFACMLYSILRHRRAKGQRAPNFHASTTVEVVWILIPLLIIIAMAIPATKAVLAGRDASHAAAAFSSVSSVMALQGRLAAV